MNITIKRTEKNDVCTIGEMHIDGVFECYTLEDVVRPDGVKIAGETAIPAGSYSIDITMSPRFKRMLPLLLQVKGFIGVRIHPGNTAADTEGCILVGTKKGKERIDESRIAFDRLFPKLQSAKMTGKPIRLTIS